MNFAPTPYRVIYITFASFIRLLIPPLLLLLFYSRDTIRDTRGIVISANKRRKK